jgi:deazaflavin-dependent oxidoreductase (nitroreductase family)
MARQFRKTAVRRFFDRWMTAVLRRGKGPPGIYLITVPGRRTGRPYSTPVSLVEDGGTRWLVAPYGDVGWVRNLRAAGRVTLTRGGRSEEVAVQELEPHRAAPVLKRYLAANNITRRWFDAARDSPVEDFEAEADRHPVFLIR